MKKTPRCPSVAIFGRQTIFSHAIVSYGIVLAKHMVQQVELVIFFPSNKNLNHSILLTISGRMQRQYHQLELRRDLEKDIISDNSSYTLKRITSDNAIMWCNIPGISSFYRTEYKN